VGALANSRRFHRRPLLVTYVLRLGANDALDKAVIRAATAADVPVVTQIVEHASDLSSTASNIGRSVGAGSGRRNRRVCSNSPASFGHILCND
jgi:hypothetical protein